MPPLLVLVEDGGGFRLVLLDMVVALGLCQVSSCHALSFLNVDNSGMDAKGCDTAAAAAENRVGWGVSSVRSTQEKEDWKRPTGGVFLAAGFCCGTGSEASDNGALFWTGAAVRLAAGFFC